jgi:Tfp pilus assembly protein PilX
MNRRRIQTACSVRRGYALVEILFVLGLLTIFAVVATRLFGSTVRVMHAAAEQQNTTSALDSALRALRRDVWNASSVAATDAHTLRIAQAEQSVEWSVDADGNLVRSTRPASGPETRQRWPELRKHVSFQSSKAGVTVQVLDQRHKPVAQVSLVGQVILAREAQQ